MHARIPRRSFLVAAVVLGAGHAGCKAKEARCRTCGMKIDAASPWRADLLGAKGEVVGLFDTPRCALLAWRGGKVAASSLRVADYYDRRPRDGAELRFVVGSDVLGPMGPDLVPVDPERATKFMQDHAAERALKLEEITEATLAALR